MEIKTILIFKALIVSVLSNAISLPSGEKYAGEHQFPYQVALKISLSPVSDYFYCGGSLISPEYVLTAASCLYGEVNIYPPGFSILSTHIEKHILLDEVVVVLGNNEVNDRNYLTKGQSIQTYKQNFIVHKDYDPENKKVSNIGLINLPERAKINEFVNIVNLPSKSIGDFTNKSLIATGWEINKNKIYPNYNPVPLRYTEIKIIESYDEEYIISNEHCVQNQGGSFVIQEVDGSYTQIGLIVGQHKSCKNGYYPYPLKVSAYLDWISNNTGIAVKN